MILIMMVIQKSKETNNDEDSRIYPGNAQFEAGLCVVDYDGDGFGDSTAQEPYDKGNDCDDGTADINPLAVKFAMK